MHSHNLHSPYDNNDDLALTDEENLSAGLIGTPAAGTIPAVKGQSMMQVTAPATLPEGYEFSVMLGSLKFPVKVPPGGVEEGQTFMVPIPTSGIPQIHTTSIPVGAWRDDLDGCFNYGMCHPHFWTACACSLLAAGQVINRLQFTWRGKPSRTAGASARAFGIIMYITLFHWFMYTITELSIMFLDPNIGDDTDILDPEERKPLPGSLWCIIIIYKIFQWIYIAMTAYVLWSLRMSVRTKYAIPGDSCSDGAWSLCCPCLVAGQLLRHTTDYDVYPSQLCSSTGLPKNAPTIV